MIIIVVVIVMVITGNIILGCDDKQRAFQIAFL